MNVRELKEWLSQYPDNFEVVIASDEEGNDFHRAYELSHGHFYVEGGDAYFEDRVYSDDDYTDREATIDESTAVCIWP